MSNPNENPWRAVALVSAIGIDLAICVIAGVWLGRWLDGYFDTNPLFLILGIFLGLGIGILFKIKIIKKLIIYSIFVMH